MNTRDQRYIRIAKACLRAINQASNDPEQRQSDIQRVYEAIDEAFRQEFERLEQDLQLAREALRQIAESEEQKPQAVRDLASQALSRLDRGPGAETRH